MTNNTREYQDAWRKANPERVRSYRLKSRYSKYGLTEEQYGEMLSSQDGRCAICFTDDPGGKGEWCVDHDHSCCDRQGSCGKCVRGLLCTQCNSLLAMARDNVLTLQSAMNYLNTKTPLPIRKAN